MAKQIKVRFNEKTLKYEIDLSGYDGNNCEDEMRKLLKLLRAEGVEVDITDSKKKPPQIPLRKKQKVGA